MLDTHEASQGIRPDTEGLGPHLRLTDAAVARAQTKLGIDRQTQATRLSKALGLSNRMMLWRLERGHYNIPAAKAMAIADLLDLPLPKAFARPATPDHSPALGTDQAA